MKILKGAIVLVLFAVSIIALPAQTNNECDKVVYDGAKVLGDITPITVAAEKLIAQGADVRVRTIPPTSNMDLTAKAYVAFCTSWQNPYRQLKSSLVVIMVDPVNRHMGTYAGSAWKKPLGDTQLADIRHTMAPYFAGGEWSKGLIAGLNMATAKIVASLDQTIHQQATDYSGLWRVLMFALGIGVGIFLLYVLIMAFVKAKKRKDELQEAQANAVAAKNEAASKISTVGASIDEWVALHPGHPNTGVIKAYYFTASESFSRLNTSTTYDPNTNKLSLGVYSAMATQYQRIIDTLGKAVETMNETSPLPGPNEYHVSHQETQASSPSNTHDSITVDSSPKLSSSTVYVESVSEPAYYPPVVPIPIIIDNPVIEREYHGPYNPPVEEESTRDYGSSSDYSSPSVDSSSGSSSDWSTSTDDNDSSGSSSDYSSDYSSSSSDTSGGSSDF